MSKKNNSQNVIIGLVFLSFLLATGIYTGIIPMSIFGSDFTVTSISTSQVISNDQDVEGAWFLINTVLGGGQHITGVIDPSEFKRQSGYETEESLTLKADVKGEQIDYTINNEARSIYKYSISNRETCPTGTIYKILLHDTGWLFPEPDSYICVAKTTVATKGTFNNPSVGFDADLTLKVGVQSITKPVSNTQSSVSFMRSGETLATAQWTGSLVSGDAVPNQDNFCPYFYSTFYGSPEIWYVAKSLDYNEWMASETTTDSQLQLYQSHPHDLTCDSKQACINIIENVISTPNWRADKILNSDYRLSDNQDKINPTSAGSSSVRVYLYRQINHPQILFKVRAKWVNVVIPVSEAIITDASCDTFTSGQQGIIKVTIKNIGNSDMTALTSFSGCEPFQQAYSSPKTPIGAGETETVLLHISSGASNVDLTKTCSVRVQDYNQPANFDTESVRVSMTTAYTCIPNKYEIKGLCIWQCNSVGSADAEIKCCEFGVDYEAGKAGSYDGWFCKGDPDVVLECEIDADCDDNNPDTLDRCEGVIWGLMGKECRHYMLGTCLTASECDDDNFLTKDSCVGSSKILNIRGACTHTPDYLLIFGSLIAAGFAIMLILKEVKFK